MTFGIRFLALILVGTAIAGCQPYWQTEPDFGSSVNNAIRAQAVNPEPPKGDPYAKARMDGVAASKSVDNYQKSFDKPKADSGSLITINNGAATGASASGIR